MKKETLFEIILGTFGGLVLAIGMCLCLISEWNTIKIGVILSLGGIILLSMIPICQKKKKTFTLKMSLPWVIGIIGALVMGFGMSKTMADSISQSGMIIGLITGVLGFILCVLNYPVYAYLKGKKS